MRKEPAEWVPTESPGLGSLPERHSRCSALRDPQLPHQKSQGTDLPLKGPLLCTLEPTTLGEVKQHSGSHAVTPTAVQASSHGRKDLESYTEP